MKLLRRLHLYLGVFFAPMLLFFVLTGWYQTLNPNRLKSPSEAETWLQKLRVVHVDQIYPTENEIDKPSSPKKYRAFVVVMSAASTLMILLGLVLAFKTLRTQWPIWLSLVLGIATPAFLLWLGQGR
jgi:hypothetical protein